MSSNPCCSGLWRQTAEGVVRGVAYCPRQQVLLATRLEFCLAAGSVFVSSINNSGTSLYIPSYPIIPFPLDLHAMPLGSFNRHLACTPVEPMSSFKGRVEQHTFTYTPSTGAAQH